MPVGVAVFFAAIEYGDRARLVARARAADHVGTATVTRLRRTSRRVAFVELAWHPSGKRYEVRTRHAVVDDGLAGVTAEVFRTPDGLVLLQLPGMPMVWAEES